jgi:hypothetical protein
MVTERNTQNGFDLTFGGGLNSATASLEIRDERPRLPTAARRRVRQSGSSTAPVGDAKRPFDGALRRASTAPNRSKRR